MKYSLRLFFIGLAFSSFSSIAFTQPAKPSFESLIFNRFNSQVGLLPEKLYLQTDKPYYSAGENIWFKSYLVNATTHSPNTQSKFIYVELIDKSDSVFQRIKIKKDSLGFAGRFVLPPEMPAGYYTLRAYSYWMRNAGEDFFFKKVIFIGNTIDDRVNPTISYSKPLNGKVIATVTFKDANKNPIISKQLVGRINWTGKKLKSYTVTTDKNGVVSFPIEITSSSYKNKALEVEFKDPQLKFQQKFFLPTFSDEFDVQFFPEGGSLLANCMQTIAFKAIGSNGLGINISGSIVDSLGTQLCQFQSLNKGMGQIMLEAKAGQSYYAIVKNASGTEKKILLPRAKTEGVIIQLKPNHNKIYYQVINKSNIDVHSLYLLIHSRGQVMAIKQLDSLSLMGQISGTLLPAGICSFSVMNSVNGTVLSERLSFISKPLTSTFALKTDKPSYGKRESVNLNFSLLSKDSLPADGNFSLSITDSHTVIQDSLADNIQSNLLLTSDLQGYVEDPGSYFCGNPTQAHVKLDLLMLTQGWKRFEFVDIRTAKISQPQFYMEAGQALSGKVLNLIGKPSKNADIIMLSPGLKAGTKFVKTDSLGRFLIDGISFPDSTSFILKAKKTKSFGDVEIIPDPDDFPIAKTFIPLKQEGVVEAPADYFSQIKEKYFYEGGVRMIGLDEVTVTAKKIDPNKVENYYSGMADNTIDTDALDKMPGMSLLNVLSTIAGVQVTGEDVTIRGSMGPPMLMIDEMEEPDLSQLSYLTTNDISDISVFKGANAAIFGSRGGNGVITITLKTGVQLKAITPPSMAVIKPLGFQKSAQFYVPKYEVDSILKNINPDLRTTIYWNPSLSTDKNGIITTKFPTADKANDYTVTMEGISKTGEIYRYVGIIRRKKE